MRQSSHFFYETISLVNKMNLYIDLSIVSLILQGVSSLYFLKNILMKPVKWYNFIFFGIVSTLPLLSFYFNGYIVLTIYYLLVIINLYVLFKKQVISSIFLFLLFRFISEIVILLFFKGVKLKYDFIFISDKSGLISLISYPLIIILTISSTLFVDKIYHFNHFKERIIIVINNKKYDILAYFDTGNVTTLKGNPVIFIGQNIIEIEPSLFNKKLTITTLAGKEEISVCECLVNIPINKEYKFAYIAIRDVDNFHGCECLLNAYLF